MPSTAALQSDYSCSYHIETQVSHLILTPFSYFRDHFSVAQLLPLLKHSPLHSPSSAPYTPPFLILLSFHSHTKNLPRPPARKSCKTLSSETSQHICFNTKRGFISANEKQMNMQRLATCCKALPTVSTAVFSSVSIIHYKGAVHQVVFPLRKWKEEASSSLKRHKALLRKVQQTSFLQ